MQKGMIFNIQKFSVNDGPGIRTTVFMKGCSLDCIWCHNPESKLRKPELMYNAAKCINCRACEIFCPQNCHTFENDLHNIDRIKCLSCGMCEEECPTGAIEIVGKETSVDEIMNEVLKDEIFYKTSGGGVTLSGGEPMFQAEFTRALLKSLKEKNIHTCMETCGFAGAENYKAVAEFVDIFLFDYKIADSEEHKKYIGSDNKLILENLKMLDSLGCNIILRCPVIPGINDNDYHFEAIAKTANELNNVLEINVEPYHPLGAGKAENLGKEYLIDNLKIVEDEVVEKWIDKISQNTKITVKKA